MRISAKILGAVMSAGLLSGGAMAQTKDGTVSSDTQKSICHYVGYANRDALDLYLDKVRGSADDQFETLKDSYPFITCMGEYTLIQWAALSGETRIIATLVNEYDVPINSIDRNGESELDRLDYLDREKGDGDGTSYYAKTARFLRKKLAERGG